jgi:transcriptional/translational regulatory protein YebC/TACO1
MELALELGAEDIREDETEIEIITDQAMFESVRDALEAKGLKYIQASVGMIPQNTVKLEDGKAEQMLKMIDKLEDNDDVQNVYANFDIDDEIVEKFSS